MPSNGGWYGDGLHLTADTGGTIMFTPTLTADIEETFEVEESDAKVVIKYLRPGVLNTITQSSMQLSAKQHDTADMRSEISFNLTKKNRDIVFACVKKWSGFTNSDSEPMKFTRNNLAKMIDESDEFVDWVVEKQEGMAEKIESQGEAVAKN
jgi:hypothetical protein